MACFQYQNKAALKAGQQQRRLLPAASRVSVVDDISAVSLSLPWCLHSVGCVQADHKVICGMTRPCNWRMWSSVLFHSKAIIGHLPETDALAMFLTGKHGCIYGFNLPIRCISQKQDLICLSAACCLSKSATVSCLKLRLGC